jgi:hypothetical protein
MVIVVMGVGRVRVGAVRRMSPMRRCVMMIVVGRLGAGEARAGAHDGNRGGENEAQQRQEDDRLIHAYSWRMILTENRFPLFGIMR